LGREALLWGFCGFLQYVQEDVGTVLRDHILSSPPLAGSVRTVVTAPSLLPIHFNAMQQKPLAEMVFLRTSQTCRSCAVPNLSCCVGNTFKRWRKWDWLSACKRIPQFVLLHTDSLTV